MSDDRFAKDLVIDTGSSIAGAIAGLAVAGPPGAIAGSFITPVLTDVLKRFLSKKEKGRIEKVAELAIESIAESLAKGQISTKDPEEFNILLEGTLLTARDSYEDKKIPFLANLVARAPFTNTPTKNIIQTLKTAEQLSYRQFCILAVIYKNMWADLGLSKEPFYKEKHKQVDEKAEGVYNDINYMIVDGIVGMVLSKGAGAAIASGVVYVTPANLQLLYPGRLLVNAMLLDTIDQIDLKEIIDILKFKASPSS